MTEYCSYIYKGEADKNSFVVVPVLLLATNADTAYSVRKHIKNPAQKKLLANAVREKSNLIPFAGFSDLEILNEIPILTKDVYKYYINEVTKKAQSSYVDYLKVEKPRDVGSAGAVVIHSWNSPFESIYESVQTEISDLDTQYLWIDISLGICIQIWRLLKNG